MAEHLHYGAGDLALVEQADTNMWEANVNGRIYSGTNEISAVYAAMHDLAWREERLHYALSIVWEWMVKARWDAEEGDVYAQACVNIVRDALGLSETSDG